MYELTFLVSENISKQQLGIYLDYCPVKVRNNCFKRNSELKGFQNWSKRENKFIPVVYAKFLDKIFPNHLANTIS